MTEAGWQLRKLDELGKVSRGKSKHRPRNDPSLYGGRYPFFQTGDIKAANLYVSNAQQTYNDLGLAQSRLWSKGTLCITIAANIAESALLAVEGCFPDSVVGFIADPDLADARFVKYSLDTMKTRMQSISRGTTQDNLSVEKLLSFRLNMPGLETQRRIADILSTYDTLIEINAHRIEIIEEMAHRIFEEWFVFFKFPGHELINIVDSAIGPLPEGWQAGRLEQVIVLQRGFDLPTSTRSVGRYPVIAATGIHGTHAEAKVRGPGVTTGRSGSLGTVLHVAEDFWPLNTTLWGREFPLGSTYYAFFVLQRIDLKSRNAGAAVPTLNRNDIHRLPVPIPPLQLIRKFDSYVAPLFELKTTLIHSNDALRRARDLLLPKLISGEIDLNADIDIPLANRTAAE